jgi:hypothetical protein
MSDVLLSINPIVWGAMLAELKRLREALQDAKDLAVGDAPAHMIVDVCDRALARSE